MTASRLAAALAGPGPRLDHVALAVAALDDEPPDHAWADPAVVAALDDWGAQVAARARGSIYAGMDALEALLVGQLGFVGDRDDYDAPANSFLPRVLARRRGLPITLSVVYLEVARRAGLPLFGVGLPGHFVVAYAPDGRSTVVIDPFERGRLLTRADLDAIAARAGTAMTAALLAPTPVPAIAARMLRNLGASYRRRGRPDKVAEVATLAAVVDRAVDADRVN